jgi:hypothetical protein
MAEARQAQATGEFVTAGPCNAIAGLDIPSGIHCALHPRPTRGFLVTIAHVDSPAGCTWDSTAIPNLACS